MTWPFDQSGRRVTSHRSWWALVSNRQRTSWELSQATDLNIFLNFKSNFYFERVKILFERKHFQICDLFWKHEFFWKTWTSVENAITFESVHGHFLITATFLKFWTKFENMVICFKTWFFKNSKQNMKRWQKIVVVINFLKYEFLLKSKKIKTKLFFKFVNIFDKQLIFEIVKKICNHELFWISAKKKWQTKKKKRTLFEIWNTKEFTSQDKFFQI